MKKTIDVILNRFQENLTMTEMLRLSGMSKATFARQFRKHTGRTFTHFLNEVRIDHACRRLLDTEDSISEIAYDSGFASLSHFNHCFQSLRHVSPRAYRQQRPQD
jgi:AraC-like DNA-binding protein